MAAHREATCPRFDRVHSRVLHAAYPSGCAIVLRSIPLFLNMPWFPESRPPNDDRGRGDVRVATNRKGRSQADANSRPSPKSEDSVRLSFSMGLRPNTCLLSELARGTQLESSYQWQGNDDRRETAR